MESYDVDVINQALAPIQDGLTQLQFAELDNPESRTFRDELVAFLEPKLAQWKARHRAVPVTEFAE